MEACWTDASSVTQLKAEIDSNFHSKDELSHGIRYFKAISNIHTMDIGTPPVKVCFCNLKDNQHNCTYQHPPINTDSGDTITISLAAVDEVDNAVRNADVYGFLKGNNSGFCQYI